MTTNEYIAVFGIIISIAGSGILAWINMRVNHASFKAQTETKLMQLEADKNKFDSKFDTVTQRIFDKLDEIQRDLHNKADK